MVQPLVDQLRFARHEWQRALDGVSPADALVRLEPMNSIGWIVAHLAWHEQASWFTRLRGETPFPEANRHGVNGQPASTPTLAEALGVWRSVTTASDPILDGLAAADLRRPMPQGRQRTVGSTLLRVIYHYWFHIGEITAVRQLLHEPAVPEFVGSLDTLAPYRAEAE
jgi:uncharacterized damage-inducible protein DinB